MTATYKFWIGDDLSSVFKLTVEAGSFGTVGPANVSLFQPFIEPAGARIVGVDSGDDQTIWMWARQTLIANESLFKSIDGGVNWVGQKALFPKPQGCTATCRISDNDVWIAGVDMAANTNREIIHWDGATYTTKHSYVDLAFSGPQNIVAVGTQQIYIVDDSTALRGIIYSLDGGSSWNTDLSIAAEYVTQGWTNGNVFDIIALDQTSDPELLVACYEVGVSIAGTFLLRGKIGGPWVVDDSYFFQSFSKRAGTESGKGLRMDDLGQVWFGPMRNIGAQIFKRDVGGSWSVDYNPALSNIPGSLYVVDSNHAIAAHHTYLFLYENGVWYSYNCIPDLGVSASPRGVWGYLEPTPSFSATMDVEEGAGSNQAYDGTNFVFPYNQGSTITHDLSDGYDGYNFVVRKDGSLAEGRITIDVTIDGYEDILYDLFPAQGAIDRPRSSEIRFRVRKSSEPEIIG